MPEFKRVKDNKTGAEYTTARVLEGHTVLPKPAVDRNGAPLPAKPRANLGAVKSAAKADESTPSNGPSVETDHGKGKRSTYAHQATAEKE